MQEIFLIVRASRIELSWSPDGKSVCFEMKGEYQLLFQINLEEQKNKIAIENPTFYYNLLGLLIQNT
jgi:hypothetical protein